MRCPSCGVESRVGDKSCVSCGVGLIVATDPASSSAAAIAGSTGFVGRQPEMAQLTDALDEAVSGQGRLAMLVGEPGIGKTRTAQELATLAATLGAQVHWGRCYEDEGAPPYTWRLPRWRDGR